MIEGIGQNQCLVLLRMSCSESDLPTKLVLGSQRPQCANQSPGKPHQKHVSIFHEILNDREDDQLHEQ